RRDFSTLSLHDALPISVGGADGRRVVALLRELWPADAPRPSRPRRQVFSAGGQLLPAEDLLSMPRDGGETALVTGATGVVGRRRSEEHTSELQSRENLV